MIKYPDTEQFRHTVKHVIDRAKFENVEPPTLRFHGSVKLHGTNSSIILYPDGNFTLQSRNNTLKDNGHFGFVNFVNDNIDTIKKHFYLRDETKPITIYGEWCGEGIQKGNIAIAQLEKMFVIFGIRIGEQEDSQWIEHDLDPVTLMSVEELNKIKVYHINQFETWTLDIDFSQPQLSQNILVETTRMVEECCPVGQEFGVSGTGEGIVWKCIIPGYCGSDYWFKVKGEKHSPTKVKTLAEVDVEKLKTVNEFVDRTVTEVRLQQSIEYLKEMGLEVSQKSTGQFLSWVFGDIMKEEKDVLEASGLDRKDIGKDIGTKARKWFFEYLDKEIGL